VPPSGEGAGDIFVIYAFVGDGCLQEGIGQEMISLAGHLRLGKLILCWDDNRMTDDGSTELSISENVAERFRVADWHVIEVDGHDIEAIAAAITLAKRDPHSPLTPATRGMIGLEELRAMQRRPLIINTARGGLVVEDDLVRALDEGLISGSGFDVTEGEPPAVDSPLMRIASRPNVILTPHVAWASDEAQQALADQLMDNIDNFVRGEPTNRVEGSC
jgi:lactate dehydrogenase-like 2-hydroxyacid dehydrogenase